MRTIYLDEWCRYDRKGQVFYYKNVKYTFCSYADNIEGQVCYVVYNHETKRHSVWQWYDKRKVVVYQSLQEL